MNSRLAMLVAFVTWRGQGWTKLGPHTTWRVELPAWDNGWRELLPRRV